MQKQKRAPKLRRKVASLLTLALVLVPMMALIAYAGSAASNFPLVLALLLVWTMTGLISPMWAVARAIMPRPT